MKSYVSKLFIVLFFGLASQLASADVSGNWVFAVDLGDIGAGSATITLNQEAEGRLTGTYSGQLANGPVSGTYEGNNFSFSFNSDLLGGEIIYRGALRDDGTVAGTVVVQGQDLGTFTGNKQ